MVLAYRELTQYVSVSNGCFVIDGVSDGLVVVTVSVGVAFSVGVNEGVRLFVGVGVNVKEI
jgi:hypothetical protein